jgi:hypothetical protein
MKKIKRKAPRQDIRMPTFVIGYTSPDAVPAGFLAAWFAEEYGGPLDIRLQPGANNTTFVAQHGPWAALVDTNLAPAIADQWHDRLEWSHRRVAQVLPYRLVLGDSRNIVLHVARLARGMTLLTQGTAHDTTTHRYWNPSDWSDRWLREFHLDDHVRIEHVSEQREGRVWFYTRGLAKFGLEEIETHRPTGLSERPVLEAFMEISERLIDLGKAPNVGEAMPWDGRRIVRIVRHRTDDSAGDRLNLREIDWDN